MPMNIFNLAASAMNAQSQRMNVTASNLANVDSFGGPDGQPYRARQVVFEVAADDGGEVGGVRVAEVVEDQSPLRLLVSARNGAPLPGVMPGATGVRRPWTESRVRASMFGVEAASSGVT